METDCGQFAVAGGNLNSSDTTYGSAIEVTCDSGHSVTGSSVVECQADGTWSSSPTCVEDGMLYWSHETVHCLPCTRHNNLKCFQVSELRVPCTIPFSDCGQLSIANANVTVLYGTLFGANATVGCLPGYTLSGTATVECGATGWSTRPTCDINGRCLLFNVLNSM